MSTPEERLRIAVSVREELLCALLEAWESAGTSGLCAEGRWEVALEAARHLDLDRVAEGAAAPTSPRPRSRASDLS